MKKVVLLFSLFVTFFSCTVDPKYPSKGEDAKVFDDGVYVLEDSKLKTIKDGIFALPSEGGEVNYSFVTYGNCFLQTNDGKNESLVDSKYWVSAKIDHVEKYWAGFPGVDGEVYGLKTDVTFVCSANDTGKDRSLAVSVVSAKMFTIHNVSITLSQKAQN